MCRVTSTVLDVAAFREQMDWLVAHNFTTASIGDIACKTDSAGPKVILSFDDGYIGNYECVLPILKERDLVATFFVTTGQIGTQHMMSWNQVRELSDAGQQIGSHTVSHRLMCNLGSEDTEYELECSKKTIEDKIGRSVDYLSLPYGSYNPMYRRAAVQAGYRGGASSMPGVNNPRTDPYFLRRMPIETGASLDHFIGLCQFRRRIYLTRGIRHRVTSTARMILGEARYLAVFKRLRGIRDS
jgi:peptidoglycan/xylan/chitin deacetylase (PgdA/CDA1 family)